MTYVTIIVNMNALRFKQKKALKNQTRIISLAIILLALLFTACTREQFTQEQQILKQKCTSDGHAWMKMSPMHKEMMTGPACYGCMINDNTHVCTLAEYEEKLQ